MTRINFPLTVATVLTIGLSTAIPEALPTALQARYDRAIAGEVMQLDRWYSSQSYVPPNREAPRTTVGGATRGSCLQGEILRSLMPSNNLALTTADYPTLYWYIPQSNAKALEFELRDASGNSLVAKTFAVPSTPGIVSFTLPKSELPPLKVGKMYHWYFKMVCYSETDPDDRSGNVIVDGWIERTELNSTLAARLEKANLSDRPALYAQAGIWQDSLTSLVDLRRVKPDDSTVAVQWEKLLKSVGLDSIVEEPLIDCCTPNN